MSIRDMESDQNLQQQNVPAQGITSNIWSLFEAVWSFYEDADQDQNFRDIIISGTLNAWKEQSEFENEWKQYNNKCSEQSLSFHSEDTDQVVWNNINANNHNHLKIIDRVESKFYKNAKQFKASEEECIDDHVGGSDVVMNYKLDPLVEMHAKYISEFYKEYPQLKLDGVTEQEIRQSITSPFVFPERLQENFGLVQILIDDVKDSQCSDGSGFHQLSILIHKENRRLTNNFTIASPLNLAERALFRSNQRRIEHKLTTDVLKRIQSTQRIVHRNDPSIMSSYNFQLSDEEMVQSQYYDSYGSEQGEELQQSQLVAPGLKQPQFELINTDQSNIEFQQQNDDGITDSFESFTNQQDLDKQSLIRPMKLRRSNSQIQIQQGSYTSSEDSVYRSNQKMQKQVAGEDQQHGPNYNEAKKEQYGQISKKNFSKYFMSSSEDSEC